MINTKKGIWRIFSSKNKKIMDGSIKSYEDINDIELYPYTERGEGYFIKTEQKGEIITSRVFTKQAGKNDFLLLECISRPSNSQNLFIDIPFLNNLDSDTLATLKDKIGINNLFSFSVQEKLASGLENKFSIFLDKIFTIHYLLRKGEEQFLFYMLQNKQYNFYEILPHKVFKGDISAIKTLTKNKQEIFCFVNPEKSQKVKQVITTLTHI
jgi:hypothetical protein